MVSHGNMTSIYKGVGGVIGGIVGGVVGGVVGGKVVDIVESGVVGGVQDKSVLYVHSPFVSVIVAL